MTTTASFVLRLNGLDERGDILGGAAAVFGELANFVGDDRETTAGFTSAGRFDSGVESEQVGLLRDVVNDVDDFRNFQRTIAQRFNFLGGGLHGSANALHAVQSVANGTVSLFGGVESATRGFSAGLGVIGNLFHRDGEFFHGAGGVGDFLILLRGAGLHFVGGDKNVVRASGNFHGGLADAFENLHEIVQHVVDGIRDVAERVVGDFAARRQVAASHLVDDVQQFGDATLQRLASFLIVVGLRDASDGAIQVFRDVAKLVGAADFRARTGIACGEALGKFSQLSCRRRELAAQQPEEKRHGRQGNRQGENGGAASGAAFEHAGTAGLPSGVIGQPDGEQ